MYLEIRLGEEADSFWNMDVLISRRSENLRFKTGPSASLMSSRTEASFPKGMARATESLKVLPQCSTRPNLEPNLEFTIAQKCYSRSACVDLTLLHREQNVPRNWHMNPSNTRKRPQVAVLRNKPYLNASLSGGDSFFLELQKIMQTPIMSKPSPMRVRIFNAAPTT